VKTEAQRHRDDKTLLNPCKIAGKRKHKHELVGQMRLNSIDAARAAAVTCVVIAHLPIAGTSNVSPYFSAFAAPFFLIVAGLGYEFLIRSKTIFNIISRSIILYFLPLFVGALIGGIMIKMGQNMSQEFLFSLFKWNIFQVIAVGYLMGIILRSILLRVAAIIGVFIISFFNFNSVLTIGVFPLLPWISYFLAGQIAFDLWNEKNRKIEMPLLIGLSPFFVYSPVFINANRDTALVFLAISSAVILFINATKTLDTDKYDISIGLGRIAFSAYYLHLMMLYLIKLLDIEMQTLSLFIFIMSSMVLLEFIWKRNNYRFGMEWILREGSNKLSLMIESITRKIWIIIAQSN